jgi:hypothetical protein
VKYKLQKDNPVKRKCPCLLTQQTAFTGLFIQCDKPILKSSNLSQDGFSNEYNFMRVSDEVLNALHWPIGEKVNVTLDVQDGILIVKKA